MDQITQIKALEERVLALIAADSDLFLVEINIKPTNNIKRRNDEPVHDLFLRFAKVVFDELSFER